MSKHRKNKIPNVEHVAGAHEMQSAEPGGGREASTQASRIGESAYAKVTPIRASSPRRQGVTPAHAERLIRKRAYELYEQRGRGEGHAEEDWLRAEAEVMGSVLRKAALEPTADM